MRWSSRAVQGCGPGGIPGGGIGGWVPGRAIPGTQPARARSTPDSEAGPGSPQWGLEWVVWGVDACPAVFGSQVPPCGPGRSWRPSLYLGPSGCRLLANRGRDSVSFLIKLVKTA